MYSIERGEKMYEALNERTDERLCGFFDEDDLIEAIESCWQEGDLWDVFVDGRLEYYFCGSVYS